MLGCVDIGANETNTGGSVDCRSAGAGEQRQERGDYDGREDHVGKCREQSI